MLYGIKKTRNLIGVKGDTGAWLRNTMGALALCGVPPGKYFPDPLPALFSSNPKAVYTQLAGYTALVPEALSEDFRSFIILCP